MGFGILRLFTDPKIIMKTLFGVVVIVGIAGFVYQWHYLPIHSLEKQVKVLKSHNKHLKVDNLYLKDQVESLQADLDICKLKVDVNEDLNVSEYEDHEKDGYIIF